MAAAGAPPGVNPPVPSMPLLETRLTTRSMPTTLAGGKGGGRGGRMADLQEVEEVAAGGWLAFFGVFSPSGGVEEPYGNGAP